MSDDKIYAGGRNIGKSFAMKQTIELLEEIDAEKIEDRIVNGMRERIYVLNNETYAFYESVKK